MSMPIGVGVVIDDQIDSEPDGIDDIVQQLKADGMPIVSYSDLPSESVIQQFGTVSFLILDWNLSNINNEQKEAGVQIDPALTDWETDDKVSFIQQFHKRCSAPVFIFTNEGIDDIKSTLGSHNLFNGDERDFIFIKSKNELRSSDADKQVVSREVCRWVSSSPVIHLIAEWNKSLFAAQGKMFADFYEGSHQWPKLLWNAYKRDRVDPNAELVSMIVKNLFSRFECAFDPLIIAQSGASESSTVEMMAFLEKAISIPNDSLGKKHGSGDIFKRKSTDGNLSDYPYLLNISCECDCVRNDGFRAMFLGGKVVSRNKVFEGNGALRQPLSRAYVIPVDGNQCLCFEFSQHETIVLSNLNLSDRICRLTAPYLTDIRQRYAHWIQREGLPVYPS